MQTDFFKSSETRFINGMCDADEAMRYAEQLRDDAKMISGIYAHIEKTVATNRDTVQAELLGMIEAFRLKVLELAEDADGRAEDLEMDDRNDALYGSYDQQVRATYRAMA